LEFFQKNFFPKKTQIYIRKEVFLGLFFEKKNAFFGIAKKKPKSSPVTEKYLKEEAVICNIL